MRRSWKLRNELNNEQKNKGFKFKNKNEIPFALNKTQFYF
jgi:hypothetical protein